MQDRPVPYNTGKVLIGSRYEPPRQNLVISEDATLLQAALLGDRYRPFRVADYAVFAVLAFAVFVLAVILIREIA